MKKFQKELDKRLEFYYNVLVHRIRTSHVRVMKKLTQKEVCNWMMQLAQSQVFYGRLLRDFNNAEAYVRRNFMSALHENKVKDILDFIMYIEA